MRKNIYFFYSAQGWEKIFFCDHTRFTDPIIRGTNKAKCFYNKSLKVIKKKTERNKKRKKKAKNYQERNTKVQKKNSPFKPC